ncbi:hypothetical protein GQ42DRAFT_117404 [Ramicandelaber brevisporus]|nr:hypothetical protein GQ42DRAFT_117404 [Ramicandelaber brevisporus]
MLDKGDSELRSDGTSIVIKPDRKALARLSIVRGNIDSPLFSVPFVDDYIIAVEPVADYVTRYSGIRRNDLTPNKSKYHLVSRKTAYCKLRTLIDAGCIFVGHGLRNDLRVLNVFVPPDQLIDTSTLFQSKQHRRIVSLRFLVWFLFNEDIQRSEHDSIVDAQSTLKVYTEYKKLVEVGQFEETLERLYRAGNELGWVPQAPHKA